MPSIAVIRVQIAPYMNRAATRTARDSHAATFSSSGDLDDGTVSATLVGAVQLRAVMTVEETVPATSPAEGVIKRRDLKNDSAQRR
jgi:hypothetical protein